jgi:hypothetical protein
LLGVVAKFRGHGRADHRLKVSRRIFVGIRQTISNLIYRTLKNLMDSFEFSAEQFLVYLDQAFELLFNLLKESVECDTKMNVLGLMAFIVEKMSLEIRNQAMNLVQYLPLLWEESAEHNMLCVSIISALVGFDCATLINRFCKSIPSFQLQIIKAVYDIPEVILKFVYGIISIATNVNEPAHVYLIEEGLELWLLTVQNSPVLNDELIVLADHLIPIIGERRLLSLNV